MTFQPDNNPLSVISTEAFTALERIGYPWPCVGTYNVLVKNYPNDFLTLINSNKLNDEALSCCLQYGRYFSNSEVIKPQLTKFLDHPSSDVRIGAILGLIHHYNDSERESWLKSLLSNSSSHVRKEVTSILNQEL